MNLVIDVGNTQTKAAVFESNSIVEQFVFKADDLLEESKRILEKYQIDASIVSSVKNLREQQFTHLKTLNTFFELSQSTKLPYSSLYKTPKTLGLDRVALVSAAVSIFPQKNVLVIDAGTCITYDFIDANKNYHGGGISPGIGIRYKSLNHYTDKLPELNKSEEFSLVGKSTLESIHSGVLNGVIQEINGIISQYEQEKEDLTVVLTGGDANFLSKQLKNGIFANQNFLLYGLNKILTFNNQE